MPERPETPGRSKAARPSNEQMRRPDPGTIDQRQQQIDPCGRYRRDPDARPDTNRKQPGGSLVPKEDRS